MGGVFCEWAIRGAFLRIALRMKCSEIGFVAILCVCCLGEGLSNGRFCVEGVFEDDPCVVFCFVFRFLPNVHSFAKLEFFFVVFACFRFPFAWFEGFPHRFLLILSLLFASLFRLSPFLTDCLPFQPPT